MEGSSTSSRLPDLSVVIGLALGMAVRRSYPALPIVLTTGFSEAASAALASRFRLLQKPYGLTALSETLARAR